MRMLIVGVVFAAALGSLLLLTQNRPVQKVEKSEFSEAYGAIESWQEIAGPSYAVIQGTLFKRGETQRAEPEDGSVDEVHPLGIYTPLTLRVDNVPKPSGRKETAGSDLVVWPRRPSHR